MTRDRRRAAACRRHAAWLIRCMDSRDTAAAEALVTRLGGPSGDLDGVLAWVWRLEAERAAVSRVYRASPGWRLTRHRVPQAEEVPRAA